MEINHSSEEKGNDFIDRFGFEIEAEATRWDVELDEKGEMTTTMYIVRRGTDMSLLQKKYLKSEKTRTLARKKFERMK
jgi:hypothetical protein